MSHLRATRYLAFGILFSLMAVDAYAGINVNNGNFYIAYTDFFLPTPGIDIELTRTYNSRSSYINGYFGVGWSSEIEGFLKFDKDKIAYRQGGGGNEITFAPSNKTTWTNSQFGEQSIVKHPMGYMLTTSAGKAMIFDNKDGRLLRIADRNKNYIDFSYSHGQLQMMRDNHNNQIKISWKTFAQTPRIVLFEKGDQKARYQYSNVGDLVKASGIDGVPFDYEYDDEHNMTKITYRDGTYKGMAYNKTRDWVTQFRDRDGQTASYDYYSDKLDPENKFGTTVARWQESTPKQKEKSLFWYEFRKRADGSRYNYKAVTWINGQVTETIFTECCGTPLVISQWQSAEPKQETSLAWTNPAGNKNSTFFEYYPDGLLKKKTDSAGLITSLAYDDVHRKVASVEKGGRKIQYNYDPRGNLAWAFDSADNRRMDLGYDLTGRINTVRERTKTASGKEENRTVFFRYDDQGRPIEVKEKLATGAAGIVRFQYGPEGQMLGLMNSKNQPLRSESEMALAQRVSSTFQNILETVQPAGVSLTPEGI